MLEGNEQHFRRGVTTPVCRGRPRGFCFARSSRALRDPRWPKEADLPLSRQEKEKLVIGTAERLRQAEAIVLADYRGLNVARLRALRRALRAQRAEFRVIKNSLLLRAFEKAGLTVPTELLTGPTSLILMYDELSAPTKVLLDVARETELLTIKGGMMSGRILGAAAMRSLADLPSREQLLSQFVGLLAAPLQRQLAVLQAPVQGFLNVLNARAREA